MTSTGERETTRLDPLPGVVVGDDGSTHAAAAIRVAWQEAQQRGLQLHVVRAWSITTAVRPADTPPGIVPSVTEFEAATLGAERQRVDEILGDAAAKVAVHVVHAHPAKALLCASRGADLLVVGTRGMGGFRSLMLGSVADQCVHHADTSVLVVR